MHRARDRHSRGGRNGDQRVEPESQGADEASEGIAYLATSAVVAVSAVRGRICRPDVLSATWLLPMGAPAFSIALEGGEAVSPAAADVEEPLAEGFPPTFEGSLVFAPQDNLNTDGIHPGQYTCQVDITLARQAETVMENYDARLACRTPREW